MSDPYIILVYVAAKLHLLDVRVAELVSSAWASKTLSTRNSQWKRFIEFCHGNGPQPLPAELSTFLRFVADLSSTCKFSTINNYISAVNLLHKFYRYDIDFRSYFASQMCIAGLKKKLGKAVEQKAPLSVHENISLFGLVQTGQSGYVGCCNLFLQDIIAEEQFSPRFRGSRYSNPIWRRCYIYLMDA